MVRDLAAEREPVAAAEVDVEGGGCNARQHDELDDEQGAHDDRPAAGCFCAASPIV